jgi:hypothetical protein
MRVYHTQNNALQKHNSANSIANKSKLIYAQDLNKDKKNIYPTQATVIFERQSII